MFKRWMVVVPIWLAVTACGSGGDTSVFITNDTDQSWYVVTTQSVVAVDPGASGLIGSWSGGPTRPFWLKAPDFSLVGQFQLDDDGLYRVAGVDGFTARIEDHGSFVGDFADGTSSTTDCGGFVPQ